MKNIFNTNFKKILNFSYEHFVFLVFITVACILSLYAGSSISSKVINNHIELQAISLVNLRLDISNFPAWLNDISFYNGRYFSPFGILPSILFIPILLIIPSASQQILSLLFFISTFVVVYKISRKMGISSQTDALWISFFFNFGTLFLFLSLTNITAYTMQTISVFFILLALYFYFSKKPIFLVGVAIGLAILTRSILIFSALYFVIEIFTHSKNDLGQLLNRVLLFLIPILFCVFLVSLFNYTRFGNPLDNGYDHNFTHSSDLKIARQFGFFSPTHIPGNLYLLFFKGPDPIQMTPESYILKPPYLKMSYWGLGLFYTSPLFLYLLFVNYRKGRNLNALFTSIVMMIPILTYYAYGAWQYGYRHALDIYPFLLILLISVFRDKLPTQAKLLISFGFIFNLFYMYSIWGIYPFLASFF